MKSKRELELEAELNELRQVRKTAKEAELHAKREAQRLEEEEKARQVALRRKPLEAELDAFMDQLDALRAEYPDVFFGYDSYICISRDGTHIERQIG